MVHWSCDGTPGNGLNRPFGQFWQSLSFAPSTSLYFPTVQFKQSYLEVEPIPIPNLPRVHSVQAVDFIPSAYLPIWHVSQLVAPALLEYSPGLQAMQYVSLNLNKPGWQPSHALELYVFADGQPKHSFASGYGLYVRGFRVVHCQMQS